MLKRVELYDTEARGRNGWFTGREAVVQTLGEKLVADVRSRTPSYPGPIHLEMSHEDARRIGAALVEVADEGRQRADLGGHSSFLWTCPFCSAENEGDSCPCGACLEIAAVLPAQAEPTLS